MKWFLILSAVTFLAIIAAVIYSTTRYDQQASSSRTFSFTNRGVFPINMTVENDHAILQSGDKHDFPIPSSPEDQNVSVIVASINGSVVWEGEVWIVGSIDGYVFPSDAFPREGIQLAGKFLFFLRNR